MPSNVEIANIALQKLGAARIISFDENSIEAREISVCYDYIRRAELSRYNWRFAKKRIVLSPLTNIPLFDYLYTYQLPTDFLGLLRPQDKNDDLVIEGDKILTNSSNILNLQYIADITNTSLFHPLFVEVLATKIAWHLCEQLTQSNQKKADLTAEYRKWMTDATAVLAVENKPVTIQEDDWITCRY